MAWNLTLYAELPDGINEMRAEIPIEIKKLEETDSKKENQQLTTELDQLTKLLQKKCPHTLVVQTRDSYSGSYSKDYEDAHKSERVCLICGFKEIPLLRYKGLWWDTYEILQEKEGRLIKRYPFFKGYENICKDVGNYGIVKLWVDMEEIIKAFEK